MRSKLYSNLVVYKNRFLVKMLCASVLVIGFGCKKLVDVDPPVMSTTGASVYTLDNTAIAAVTGIYSRMNSGNGSFITGNASISLLSGLSSDELTLFNGVPTSDAKYYYFTNNLYANTTATTPGTEFWLTLYSNIYYCNSAIEELTQSKSLTINVQKQLLGEVRFVRALTYFYLLNLYGDVPLALSSDYKINASLSRTSKAKVYEQVILDLTDAQSLLSSNYLDATLLNSTTERVRPTKWAATALLARTYLYNKDWAKAEAQATAVINNLSLYSLDSLNAVFLKNSRETIWQLQPVQIGWNSEDGRVFNIPNTGPNNNSKGQPVYLSNNLLNAFETGDLRRSKWVNSITVSGKTYFFPYKYKKGIVDTSINANTGTNNIKEYQMVLRLGEQYLIRAEARAQQNNLSGAITDLDMIRQRAGIPLIANTNPSINQSTLLSTILHERQIELFTELGQRWFDLKRTNSVDAVMSAVTSQKGGTWNSNQQLYPLPLSDLQKNSYLVQNNGY